MSIKIEESSVPTQFRMNIAEHYNYMMPESRTPAVYQILISSIASLLFKKKSKEDEKVALLVNDNNGNFLIGGVVSYHKPEGDEEDRGNWSLEFTFNLDDLKDVKVQYDSGCSEFIETYRYQAKAICGGRFISGQAAIEMFKEAVNTLKAVLTANADEGKVFEIESEGYFIASSTIEDGEIIIAIYPGDAMKRIIKDDAAL